MPLSKPHIAVGQLAPTSFFARRQHRCVSTHLRHLRLSSDGAKMMVERSEDGSKHEFALVDLLEVCRTPVIV